MGIGKLASLIVIGSMLLAIAAPASAQTWPDCPSVQPQSDDEATEIQAALDKKVCAVRTDGGGLEFVGNGPEDYVPLLGTTDGSTQPSPPASPPMTGSRAPGDPQCEGLTTAYERADTTLYDLRHSPEKPERPVDQSNQQFEQYMISKYWPWTMQETPLWAATADAEQAARTAGCTLEVTLESGDANDLDGAVGLCLLAGSTNKDYYKSKTPNFWGLLSQQCPSVVQKYSPEIKYCFQYCYDNNELVQQSNKLDQGAYTFWEGK